MSQPSRPLAARLTRRRLIGRAGGLAAALAGRPIARHPPVAFAAGATLDLWSDRPDWSDQLTRILDAFTQASGTAVKLTAFPRPDYLAKVQAAVAGGAGPDVVSYVEGRAIRDAVKAGDVSDLSGKIALEGLIPPVQPQVRFGDKVWGAPVASYAIGVFYRRSLLQPLNLAPPRTWDELKAACGALRDRGTTPLLLAAADGVIPYYLYTLAASAVLGNDGWPLLLKGERKLTDPDLVAAAQLVVDLIPFASPDYATVDYVAGLARFAAGQAAMAIASSADFIGRNQIAQNGDVGFFGFPSPAGGAAATLTGLDLLVAVNARSKQQAEATALVAWLATPAAQQLVADLVSLPVHQDVAPKTDPLAQAIVEARRPPATALPAWYDLPETEQTFAVADKTLPDLLRGAMPPAKFGEALQSSLALAQPAKA